LTNIEFSRFFEVQKYLTLSGHMWGGYWLLASGEWWKSIPPDLQAVITRNASTYTDRMRRDVMKLNDTLIGKLHTQGMEVIDKPDRASMKAKLGEFYGRWKTEFGADRLGPCSKATPATRLGLDGRVRNCVACKFWTCSGKRCCSRPAWLAGRLESDPRFLRCPARSRRWCRSSACSRLLGRDGSGRSRARHRIRRCKLFVLVCRGGDEQNALQAGRSARSKPRVPLLVDESRARTRHHPLACSWVAIHSRRMDRRACSSSRS